MNTQLFVEFLEACSYQLKTGYEHLWKCFPKAWAYECKNEFGSATLLADVANGVYYSIEVVPVAGEPYVWVNPNWRDAWIQEHKDRGLDHTNCFGNLSWVEVDDVDVILAHAETVLSGERVDGRSDITIDISDEDFLRLAKLAHERDITINQMVCEIIEDTLDANDPAM